MAQSQKIKLAIPTFTFNSGSVSSGDAQTITEVVSNVFIKTNRFTMLERGGFDRLKQERDLQYTGDFIDGSVVELGKNEGAEFLIIGHVTGLSYSQVQNKDYKTGAITYSWRASIGVQLKVVDVTTTEVVASEMLSCSAVSGSKSNAASCAITGCVGIFGKNANVIDKTRGFLAKHFPIEAKIQEIQEANNGKAKMVLILGGSDMGIHQGDIFDVVKVSTMTVDGRALERETTIGELAIKEVENENFSVAKVRKGGEEIYNRFNAGETIRCKSVTVKLN